MRVCGPWSTVWIAALAAAFVYLAAAPSAKSEDLLAPTPTPGGQIEVRFGAFDHGVGSAEHNTVDINGSVLNTQAKLGGVGDTGLTFCPGFKSAVPSTSRAGPASTIAASPSPCRSPTGCFSNRSSAPQYTMGACTVRRCCPPSGVLLCSAPALRLAFRSLSIGK